MPWMGWMKPMGQALPAIEMGRCPSAPTYCEGNQVSLLGEMGIFLRLWGYVLRST